MDTKIQELTEKIYREGVEKGNEEAGRIIAEAQSRKETLLAQAREEAGRITAEAEKQAAETKKNTEAELKLFASQALEMLKGEVANLITGRIVSAQVKAAVSDKTFMQKLIADMAGEWSRNGGLTVGTPQSAELIRYFEANAKDLLDKGVKIEQVNGHPTSFTILPADGSYKVNFGEEEFTAFFKAFLRPQLAASLF